MFFPVKPGSLELYSSAGIRISNDATFFKNLARQLEEEKPAFVITLKPVQKLPSLQIKRGFFITPIRCRNDLRARYPVQELKCENIQHRDNVSPEKSQTSQVDVDNDPTY